MRRLIEWVGFLGSLTIEVLWLCCRDLWQWLRS